jgi:CHAD domain-containing protein
MTDFPAAPLSPEAKETLERAIERPSRSRAYRLKRKETTAEGVRRIAAGRLDDAIERLRDHEPAGRADAIHEARKDMKKTRSLLRLVRDGLGEGRYQAENERLRDAGRALSDARDADVKVQALAGVVDHYRNELETTEVAALEREIEALDRQMQRPSDDQVQRSIAEAVTGIEEVRGQVEEWHFEADGWELIGPGLERSYARGRRRMRDACDQPSDESVHEWRKRSKDLWYHVRLVRRSWSGVLDETADQAHELSDRLGDHHDLSLVGAEVRSAQSSNGGGPRGRLAELTSRRQDELLADAISLGRRLYAEKPKAYAARLEGVWRAWREE